MLVAMMWKYSVQQITAYGIVFLFGISAPLPLGIQVKKRQFQLFPFFFFLILRTLFIFHFRVLP